MRCFKIFFKHTWHPQQMDSPRRLNGPIKSCDVRSVNETELGELKTIPEIVIKSASLGVACRDGACRSNGTKARPEHRIESPWHYLKTLFLVSIIIALIVWIIVYVLLSQYDIL